LRGEGAGLDVILFLYHAEDGQTERLGYGGYGWGGTGQDPNARMGLLGTARNGSKITARGDTGLVARRRRPAGQGTVLTGAGMPGILIGDSGRSAAWHVAGDQHEFSTVAGSCFWWLRGVGTLGLAVSPG